MKLLPLLCLIFQVAAFTPSHVGRTAKRVSAPFIAGFSNSDLSFERNNLGREVWDSPKSKSTLPVKFISSVASFSLGTFTMVSAALAEADIGIDDVEIAALPPPYVPAIFAVCLLVGVGVLTGSLGDVMYEEASLGMQSGARAKKEMERSRSSYFKK